MKFLILVVLIVIGTAFSACATHSDENYYDRANRESEKSLKVLDKEY